MPKVLRVDLSTSERTRLIDLRNQSQLSPRMRERFDMVRLSDLGWSAPRIAKHLSTHEQTVRKHIKSFLADGFGGLPDRSRSGCPRKVKSAHLRGIRTKVAEWDAAGRKWRLADLAGWLQASHGASISTGRLSALLGAQGRRAVRDTPDP
jgi:transposase